MGINVKVDSSIPTTGTDNWRSEVQQAIAHINNISSTKIQMQYVTSGAADITIKAGTLNNNVVAQAEFPASGNPGSMIIVNLSFNYNISLSSGQKVYNIVHELGHCLGLRHTNWWFQGESNAIGIPGTPNSGSNPDPNSVMNGGTALNSWNGFSNYDRIAIKELYPRMRVGITGPKFGVDYEILTWYASVDNAALPVTYEWYYGTQQGNYPWYDGDDPQMSAYMTDGEPLWIHLTVTDATGDSGSFLHAVINRTHIHPGH